MKITLLRYLFPTLLIVLFAYPLHAEQQTYIRSYTYQASELDSKVSARAAAIGQVRHLLLSELGTYVESRIKIKQSSDGDKYSQHDITSIAAGALKTEIINESWNGLQYMVKVKLIADPEEIIAKIEARFKTNSIQTSAINQEIAKPVKSTTRPIISKTPTTNYSSARKPGVLLDRSGRVIVMARHGVGARSFEDRDELSKIITVMLKNNIKNATLPGTEVTAITDFDITETLLSEDETGKKSDYLCFLYSADMVIAAILEDANDYDMGGASLIRDMYFYIYNCRKNELVRHRFMPGVSNFGEFAREKSIAKEFRRFLKDYLQGIT